MLERVLVICTLLVSLITSPAYASELDLEIFVSEPNEINVTSVLIMGPTEMMVVCAQGTKSAAEDLADLIESKSQSLTYIFLTHPHLDHSQGAGILIDRFPDAQLISVPEVATLQRHRIDLDDALAKSRHKENAAIPSLPFQDYTEDTIAIDGMIIEIWRGIIGDAGMGHPDEPHVALYVPSLKALIPSDVVYFDAHVMMGGSTPESRAQWAAQIDDWLERDLEIVVPGHMPKTKLSELTATGALTHTRDYIRTYDRVISESATSDEVIEKMIDLYPDIQHQSALYLGTYINFKEMHRLTFNPTIETIAAWLPSSFVAWINGMIFDGRQKSYNIEE